jgi:hypothetical protein
MLFFLDLNGKIDISKNDAFLFIFYSFTIIPKSLLMKKIIFLLLFTLFCLSVSAQKQYIINDETYELKTELSGSINLLWNIIDGKYRYFVKNDDTITELVNTKGTTKKFQEEYKTILNNITKGSALSTDKVNLTLYSLRNFINKYNASVDSDYVSTSKKAVIKTRLLVFAGITNSPFINNPDNINNPQFGAEIEIFEGHVLPRHAIFFGVKHILSNDEFKYSTTQLGLGYRFRFINTEAFNLYTNVIFGAYNFSKSTFTYLNEVDELITEKNTGNGFNSPFSIGVGTDFKVSTNSYITISYNELFALFLDNKDNFSTNISLGYKINL